MRWRLRHQLLVPPLLLLIAVVAITAWTSIAAARRARQQLETRVRQVLQGLKEAPQFPRHESVLRLLRLLSGAELLEVGPDEQSVGTLSQVPDGLPDPVEALAGLRLETSVLVEGKPYLCAGTLVRRGEDKSALYIFYPEALWRDALWEAVRPSLLIGGGLGLAAVALSVWVGRRLTRRVQELERRTRQIASGDFSPMPLPAGDDEVHDLAASINDMAQKLAQLQETVQKTERLRLLGQVSGGLAHQLRNGVTGARLAVQIHQRELERGDTSDLSALEVALRQLTLIETNLKRFLDLGSRKPAAPRPCSLNTLVGEAVALMEPQCRHAETVLTWNPPALNLVVRGDTGQLQQLFLNVIGNAVEAAGPGGRVEVALSEENGIKLVEIWDSGPGPSPEVAARLFEPFVTGKPEGVGLGLAVGRQVAEDHNGRIAWSRSEGRTCFRIELGDAGQPGNVVQ